MKKIIKTRIRKSTGIDSVLGSCVIDVMLHPHETPCEINLHKLPCSKEEYPWFILEQTSSHLWILVLSAKGSIPASQCSYIMCINLPVLEDPWQLQVVIQVFSLGTKDLIKKMHEPKSNFFSSLPDPASGCSIPWGQKHQMICVSSKSSLDETKLILNDQKNSSYFWGPKKHLCLFTFLPNTA